MTIIEKIKQRIEIHQDGIDYIKGISGMKTMAQQMILEQKAAIVEQLSWVLSELKDKNCDNCKK